MTSFPLEETELILGNSNSRFSGVTSTMLQVLELQKELMKVAVLGKHHLPEDITALTFLQASSLLKRPLPENRPRVFHARRNDEVLQALALKKIFRAKIKIAFTSTAQREHSWITRWLIKKSDAVISTSTTAAAYIQGGADIIIPHGVNTEIWHPTENKIEAWQALGYPGKYGIGIFGRVRHQKGVDILVKAVIPLLKKHPDFTVIICGETTPSNEHYVNTLKEKICASKLSHRILFIGKQPFSALPKLFQAMSIVAALSRNEGFGLTVLEAMSSGTPVLTSKAGAWKDIVRPGIDGSIVPCDDVKSTQSSLDDLMVDPQKLLQMGKHAREHICDNFSIKREAAQLCAFLSSLASDPH